MVCRKGMLLALFVAVSIWLAPLSRAQDEEPASVSHARIVRLSYAEGTVQLVTQRGTENVTMNMPITEGNQLSTGSNSWAEVQLEDGSTVRLAPSTQLIFAELGRASSGGSLTTVDLDQGEAELNISRQHDDELAVTVRKKTITVKHSGRFRIASMAGNPLQIVVFKGEVDVRDADSGQQVAVKKGETFTLDPFDVFHYALAKETASDELDLWSEQRDEALRAYASNASNRGADYGQSPYQYGLSDLNYYGAYYNVPGYGYLWQPYGAGLGWDPFMNGYWAPSPFGYCWVSAYPWGWLPYRYGNWAFVPGYGWMWQPGGWGRWWRQPRLVNAPPGFHPPAPPPQGKIGVVTRNPVPGQPPGQPSTRPRRQFNNDNVQITSPTVTGGNREIDRGNSGAVHADRKPAVVERQAPEPEQNPGTSGSVGEVHRGPGTGSPRPSRTQPSAPVARPASPPSTAPAPRTSSPPPAPAPRVSSPPPPSSPRSSNPPTPRGEGGSISRPSAPAPGRPK